MPHYLLAIDQGTTSSRAIIYTQSSEEVSRHQIEIEQFYPDDGWVEHDPEEIWQTTLECCHQALKKANLTAEKITAIGISNQRETTILWERDSGKPIYPAIVWQDRRTTEYCQQRQNENDDLSFLKDKTGLLLDPYFSASKIAWLLEHVPDARQRAEQGELLFGTIDTFLLWRLTGGKQHKTDITNASRTLLFNIKEQAWDKELLDFFAIPSAILPQVVDNCGDFGDTALELFDTPIPIRGMAGDQQAAAIGQACFHPGMIKSTYGTGCFLFLNTGKQIVDSQHRLLSTVAYRINNETTYGLEGSIFTAGAAIQWLRDTLHIIENAGDTQSLAESITDNGGVYLVPAFTGLGAPYWDPLARGALLGLTRDSSAKHIARAALEAVCYQTCDLLQAIERDYHQPIQTLRVDGGMTINDWLLQFLADILSVKVERPKCIETSALGAAYLAGLGSGVYQSLAEVEAHWQLEKSFLAQMSHVQRQQYYAGWQQAVERIRS